MSEPELPANIAVLTGPQLIGPFLNWALYGVLASQTYYYYLSFGEDKRALKILVYGLFIAETAQTGIIGRDAFKTLASGWGSPSAIYNPVTLWFTGPIVDGIVGAVVQSFYGWRIYMLTKSRMLLSVIVLLALSTAATGIAVGAVSTRPPSDIDLQAQIYPLATAWLVSSAACDVLITSCMIAWYTRFRKNLLYKATDDLITRVLRFTVVSGLLTTAVAAVNVAMFLAFRLDNNFYYQCPSLVLGKLYSNSLLAMLNQRHRVNEGKLTHYLYESESNTQERKPRCMDGSQQEGVSTITFIGSNTRPFATTTVHTRQDTDPAIILKPLPIWKRGDSADKELPFGVNDDGLATCP